MAYNPTAYFDRDDYAAIRNASMRGRLGVTFRRAANGEVTFHIRDRSQFVKTCRQLEAIVDFGATSAAEVLGL